MKLIFIGTTEFGIPTLEKLKKDYELILVITQPDKPTGRKQTLTPPPIKIWAEKNKIRVEQPQQISNLKSEIFKLAPDLIIVAAYGQILPNEIFDIPKYKSINIHGSLLPKYRGASPIQAAILNRDAESGITLIQMDEKMDHGPIISKEVLRLQGHETYSDLYSQLSALAADLVIKTLPEYFNGKLQPFVQNHQYATFCKTIHREDGKIDWSSSALQIDAKIRGLNPEPGTWTTLDGKIVKILKASILKDHKIELPGKIYSDQGRLVIKTLDNSLIIEQIQPEGKAAMGGRDFFNGLKKGSRLFI